MEFRQNVAFMRETLPEAAVPQPNLPHYSRRLCQCLPIRLKRPPKVDVPLSLCVKVKFTELLAELAGCFNSTENTLSGEGLPRGKPLAKCKSIKDLYTVNNMVYNFTPAVLDGPFCEPESVTIPTSIGQCLEQDAQVLTLIGSFLDCSGFSANSLLDEASKDPEASETTRRLVVALSDLEKS